MTSGSEPIGSMSSSAIPDVRGSSGSVEVKPAGAGELSTTAADHLAKAMSHPAKEARISKSQKDPRRANHTTISEVSKGSRIVISLLSAGRGFAGGISKITDTLLDFSALPIDFVLQLKEVGRSLRTRRRHRENKEGIKRANINPRNAGFQPSETKEGEPKPISESKMEMRMRKSEIKPISKSEREISKMSLQELLEEVKQDKEKESSAVSEQKNPQSPSVSTSRERVVTKSDAVEKGSEKSSSENTEKSNRLERAYAAVRKLAEAKNKHEKNMFKLEQHRATGMLGIITATGAVTLVLKSLIFSGVIGAIATGAWFAFGAVVLAAGAVSFGIFLYVLHKIKPEFFKKMIKGATIRLEFARVMKDITTLFARMSFKKEIDNYRKGQLDGYLAEHNKEIGVEGKKVAYSILKRLKTPPTEKPKERRILSEEEYQFYLAHKEFFDEQRHFKATVMEIMDLQYTGVEINEKQKEFKAEHEELFKKIDEKGSTAKWWTGVKVNIKNELRDASGKDFMRFMEKRDKSLARMLGTKKVDGGEQSTIDKQITKGDKYQEHLDQMTDRVADMVVDDALLYQAADTDKERRQEMIDFMRLYLGVRITEEEIDRYIEQLGVDGGREAIKKKVKSDLMEFSTMFVDDIKVFVKSLNEKLVKEKWPETKPILVTALQAPENLTPQQMNKLRINMRLDIIGFDGMKPKKKRDVIIRQMKSFYNLGRYDIKKLEKDGVKAKVKPDMSWWQRVIRF